MGKPKKNLIKSINFGGFGHPARVLIEEYIKKQGNKALSQLIRRLVVIYLSDKPEYGEFKTQLLIYERKEIGQIIYDKSQRKLQIDEELRKRDINPEELVI